MNTEKTIVTFICQANVEWVRLSVRRGRKRREKKKKTEEDEKVVGIWKVKSAAVRWNTVEKDPLHFL